MIVRSVAAVEEAGFGLIRIGIRVGSRVEGCRGSQIQRIVDAKDRDCVGGTTAPAKGRRGRGYRHVWLRSSRRLDLQRYCGHVCIEAIGMGMALRRLGLALRNIGIDMCWKGGGNGAAEES